MHGDSSLVRKEKLSKVLRRIDCTEKLANLVLNQRVENVTVQGLGFAMVSVDWFASGIVSRT